jgi:hypothetical protein
METTRIPPFRTHYGGLQTTRGMFEAETFFPPIEYAKVPFDLEQVQRALFASNYRKPITLLFPKEGVNVGDTATDIEVTVELAHALYMRYEGDEPAAECYDAPDWYLRGVAHFTGPTGEQEAAPAHVRLPMNEDGSVEFPLLQVVVSPDRLKPRIATPDGE